MSVLKPGAKASEEFLIDVIVKGILAGAAAIWAPLGGTVAAFILKIIIRKFIAVPAGKWGTAHKLASVYTTDQAAMDERFIYLEILDKTETSPEELEKALVEAQLAHAKFVRRGPVV